MNNITTIQSKIKNLRIATLLTFIGINLRFVSGNVINALIFFNILKSGNPNRKYDIHAPSIPDICGDVVMIIVLTIAYIFITSNHVKNTGKRIFDSRHEMHNQALLPKKQLKDYVHHSSVMFSATILGVGMYLFSRYVLSIVLEVFFIENTTGTFFILNMLNDILRLCSPLIIVYVYCKYLSANKCIMFILNLFFIIRNLFATNMMGLITVYDLHVGAPFLDILAPMIIIHSVVCLIAYFVKHKRTVFSQGFLALPKFYKKDKVLFAELRAKR